MRQSAAIPEAIIGLAGPEDHQNPGSVWPCHHAFLQKRIWSKSKHIRQLSNNTCLAYLPLTKYKILDNKVQCYDWQTKTPQKGGERVVHRGVHGSSVQGFA